MAKYKIYGDYGYTTENLLEEFDSLSEAMRWCDEYCKQGDLGGYAMIEIAWFADNGEYTIERCYYAEDYEDETLFVNEDYLWDEF